MSQIIHVTLSILISSLRYKEKANAGNVSCQIGHPFPRKCHLSRHFFPVPSLLFPSAADSAFRSGRNGCRQSLVPAARGATARSLRNLASTVGNRGPAN